MTLKQWIRSPKAYVILCLTAYLLIISIWSRTAGGLVQSVIAVGVAVAADLLCSRIARRKQSPLPDSAVITGLIIALVLSTETPWFLTAATTLIAIGSKHLLSHKKKPIFNPAATGLLLSVLLFHTGQSWWGAFGDLPAWPIIFLLVGGYAVVNRIHKFQLVFSFLGTAFLFLLIMGLFHAGDAADALRPPFLNASLFFAFFMLTDLPTSPVKTKEQILYGIICAVAGSVVYAMYGGLMYLFIGLMCGNLYHFIRSRLLKPAARVTGKPKPKAMKA